MGLWIEREKCIGCGECVSICPGDLLFIDSEDKVVIREQRDCWDCMSCIKSCAQEGALTLKLPYSIADYGATLRPYMGKGSIRWVSIDQEGREEEFYLTR